MHRCPWCGGACDCDECDNSEQPAHDCSHDCGEDASDDDDDRTADELTAARAHPHLPRVSPRAGRLPLWPVNYGIRESSI